LNKRKPKKSKLEGPSILELLSKVEAEMNWLRAENLRLTAKTEAGPKVKPPALGKGLSQLFGGPKRH
jgi:hypothetical protein